MPRNIGGHEGRLRTLGGKGGTLRTIGHPREVAGVKESLGQLQWRGCAFLICFFNDSEHE